MPALVVALSLAGLVLPVGSAVFAYRRALAAFRDFPSRYPQTWDSFDALFTTALPELLEDQVRHLRWPAVVAGLGLACATAASVLSVL